MLLVAAPLLQDRPAQSSGGRRKEGGGNRNRFISLDD
jgi:hypothetical protein